MKFDSKLHPENAAEPRPQDLLELLVTTAHALRRFAETHMARYKSQPNLSPARMRVLKEVALGEALRMGDLAERIGVAPRTVTDLVDGLERDGMLIRRPDPTDRRATLVELAPEMKESWDQLLELFAGMSERILEPLDSDERRQLFALLTRLKSGLLGDVQMDNVWDESGCPGAGADGDTGHAVDD